MSSMTDSNTNPKQTPLKRNYVFFLSPKTILSTSFNSFNVFFDEFPHEISLDIIGITVVDAFHEPIWKTAWRMFRFYGLIDFLRLEFAFYRCKITRDTSISTQRRRSYLLEFRLVPASSINDAPYINSAIQALEPDVIVSVAAPEFSEKANSRCPNQSECINIHSGRLPVYRGMMPNFWQLLHGEPIRNHYDSRDGGKIRCRRHYCNESKFPCKNKILLIVVIVGTKQEGATLND